MQSGAAEVFFAVNLMFEFFSQGADGVRGLKGSKGEKVSRKNIILWWPVVGDDIAPLSPNPIPG